MYAEIAEQVLKDQNPQEYLRLRAQRKLQPFLENLEEQYGRDESEQMREALQNAPESPYRAREQAVEGAKLQIQEVLIAQLVEQLSVPNRPNERPES